MKLTIKRNERSPSLKAKCHEQAERESDVIRYKPGLVRYASGVKTEEDAFSIFLTDGMIAVITMFTNRKSHRVMVKYVCLFNV